MYQYNVHTTTSIQYLCVLLKSNLSDGDSDNKGQYNNEERQGGKESGYHKNNDLKIDECIKQDPNQIDSGFLHNVV